MPVLNKYFAEASLRKLHARLKKQQQASLNTLLGLMDAEGRVNFNQLRDTLSPLASSTNSANTMLTRFLKLLDDSAKEAGLVLEVHTTPDKKAGDDRWIWFEGLVENTAKPYTGDLAGVPAERLMSDQRGLPLGLPVVLMTFNEHETAAVRAAFAATSAKTEFDGRYNFTRLGLYGQQEVIHVVSSQRRGPAQQTATWALARFQPSALIALGIAFGTHKTKQRIGDVLVSECLFDYENARVNPDGSKVFRGARPPASLALFNRLRSMDQTGTHPKPWPRLFFGLLACGDKLVDHQPFIDELKAEATEVIGGDMESIGIQAAADERKTDWLVVKAISDWGDGGKSSLDKDADQQTAATNAALVVKALLEQGCLAPQPEKAPLPVPAQPPQEMRPPAAQHMGLKDLKAVPHAHVDQDACGRPARLDNKAISPAEGADSNDSGKTVLPYVREWLDDDQAPPLFALLGEYGMGKTITCQLLARQLDEERAQDPSCPIPLYFDLRHVTGLRERVPTLDETLKECMARGWLDEGRSEAFSLEHVYRWIAQGAVVLFDGLDEVLVKLTEADGQVFTNNLLKLIADAQAQAKKAGRALRLKVLIT
ncbi:MAG: hypothetical protein RIR00_1604, partial [Pseudomonadota bacterium]